MSELEASYSYCRRISRKRARNFYYSFLRLDRQRRDAMCAVYAFMRLSDDLSDEPGVSDQDAAQRALDSWRQALHRALAGNFDGHPVWPAFCDTVQRYRIPTHYFDHLLDGMASDLTPRRILTFDELYRYCYQAASVPGLTAIHIFGFKTEAALTMAERCGVAFQLTNILRDLREDAARGRVYIPAEDLERFGADPSGWAEGRPGPGFPELMEFEAQRAHAYYRESRALLGETEGASQRALWALMEIYSGLLRRMQSAGFPMLERRVGLSAIEKAGILLRSYLPAR